MDGLLDVLRRAADFISTSPQGERDKALLSELPAIFREIARQLRETAKPLPPIADKYDDTKPCYGAHNVMQNAANALDLAATEIETLCLLLDIASKPPKIPTADKTDRKE